MPRFLGAHQYRISIVKTCGEVKVRLLRKLDDGEDSRELSPLEFLAELQRHIPDIWEQTVRYYGIYSARTRVANKQRQRLPEVLGKTSNASALPLQNINDTPNAMPVNPASIDKKPVSRQLSKRLLRTTGSKHAGSYWIEQFRQTAAHSIWRKDCTMQASPIF